MGTNAYKRIPFKDRVSFKESELSELGTEEATEETALLAEETAGETAFEAFEIAEGTALVEAESGIGIPLAIATTIGAGIAYGGYKLYQYETNKEAPGVTLPLHKYLGPGNSVNQGTPYNDIDDDARLHDLAYSEAKEEIDIQKADEVFIKRTGDHLIEGINYKNYFETPLGAGVGLLGIGTKYNIEKEIGVKYPQMSGSLSESERKKYLGTDRNGGPLTLSQWNTRLNVVASNKYRTNKDAENLIKLYKRQQHNTLFNNIGEVKYKHYFENNQKYNLYNDPESDKFVKKNTEPVNTGTPSKTPDTPNKSSGIPNTPAKSGSQSEKSLEPPANTDNNQKEQPVQSATAPTELDPENMTANSTDSVANTEQMEPQYYINRGFTSSGNSYRYENSFRMRSWARQSKAFAGARSAAASNPSYVVDGYEMLPTQFLSFYIPEGVYNSLIKIPSCKPVRIGIKVTPIGHMVAFTTTSGTSNTATASHTMYGTASVGLNRIVPLDMVTITSSANVVDTATKLSSMADWIDKLWGPSFPPGVTPTEEAILKKYINSGATNNIIIPNSHPRIFLPTPPAVDANQSLMDASTAISPWNLSKYISKFPIHPTIGTPIINFDFESKWPIISSSIAPTLYVMGPANKSVQVARTGTRKRKLITYAAGTAQVSLNDTATNSTPYLHRPYNNSTYGTYSLLTLPPGNLLDQEKQQFSTSVPSVIFGVEAVQANDPNNVEGYINASVDFYVETYIEFKSEMEHEFNHLDNYNLVARSHQDVGNCNFSTTVDSNNTLHRFGFPLL